MRNFIKHRMDSEVASELLTQELNALSKRMQVYETRKDPLGAGLYKRYSKRHFVYKTCKENIDFVINVMNDYISQNPDLSKPILYKPSITSIYDIGKYQTIALMIKHEFELLLRFLELHWKQEEADLYEECIKRLNYVYSHIAKNR